MAVISNIFIDAGADYSTTVTVTDSTGSALDLTGYTAAGMVRRTYKSSTKIDFTTSIPDPSSGEIKIQLDSATTTAMKAGRYVYDIEITSSGGAVSRVVEGQLEVNPGVTY